MRRAGHERWGPAIALLVLTVAGRALGSEVAVADTDKASALLERIASADDVSYRAKQLVVYFGSPQSNALLDVSSSPKGRFVRAESGEGVTRMWSRADVGLVAGGYTNLQESTPPIVRLVPGEVLSKYAVVVGTPERVLGDELVPVSFSRRRDGTIVEKWWVHEKSGVVYRRTLYEPAGNVIGMSTVIEMQWGDPGPDDPFDRDLDRAEHVRTISAPDAPDALAGGYRFWQAYSLEIDDRAAEQWVYSDGLHALSVFQTRGNLRTPEGFAALDVGDAKAWRGPGPGTWAWQGGGRSWLVVAEEPGIDAAELIEPFPKGGPSFWSRLGSIWSRLIGAVGGLFD